ncbi:hypothetical protein ACER0C_002830 [Sarotherodon galilaeus]
MSAPPEKRNLTAARPTFEGAVILLLLSGLQALWMLLEEKLDAPWWSSQAAPRCSFRGRHSTSSASISSYPSILLCHTSPLHVLLHPSASSELFLCSSCLAAPPSSSTLPPLHMLRPSQPLMDSFVMLSGVIVAMQLPSGQNTHREEHLLSVSAAQQKGFWRTTDGENSPNEILDDREMVFSHNGLKATGNVPSKVEEKEKEH